MTISLELTSEREAILNEKARTVGIEPAEYILRLIDEAPVPDRGLLPGESLLDAIHRAGAGGVVDGTPRTDGRAWSEIEAYEFER
jgi:hypothetical protein